MPISKKHIRKPAAALSIAILTALFVTLLADYSFFSPLFQQFEHAICDLRSQFRAHHLDRTYEDIVIIDVDNRSIAKLGKMSGWPRTYFAGSLEFLNDGGARSVLFDIIFDKGLIPGDDSTFAESISKNDNVYFALTFSDCDSESFRYEMKAEPADFDYSKFVYRKPEDHPDDLVSKPCLDNLFFEFINSAAGVGFANCSPDRDGIVRAEVLLLDFNGKLYPSLPFAVILKLLDIPKNGIDFNDSGDLSLSGSKGDEYAIPLDSDGRFLIDYYGTFKTIRYISFYDVLKERVPAEFFRDKIVIIGASAPGMFDLKSVPIQRNFPGVEIHANIIANILNGDYIRRIDPAIAGMILFGLCLVSALTGIYLKTWQSSVLVILIAAGYVLYSFILFAEHGIFSYIIKPESGLFLGFLGSMIFKYVFEEKDKRFIRHAFSHFVDRTLIKEILNDPSRLKLGGEKREITILFSDIRGFTTISEQMNPEQLSAFLNIYLTEMTNIVFRHSGLLDKYIGDAVVALFGVPVAQEKHAVNGANTAVDMINVLKEIRSEFSGTPMENLEIGIGVNTGNVSVGNMGSDFHFEYTAIGDEMNLGSRLEGLTKNYGVKIIISEATAKQLDDKFLFRKLDYVQVKGKSEPVVIYQLFEEHFENTKTLVKNYQDGLEAYINKDWESAEKSFDMVISEFARDKPSQVMLERIEEYRKNPPAEEWEGVWIFDTK